MPSHLLLLQSRGPRRRAHVVVQGELPGVSLGAALVLKLLNPAQNR